MHIEKIGWFSDLQHGLPTSGTLKGAAGKLDQESARSVARYLQSGTIIAETTGETLHDELDPTRPEIGPFRTLTDGKYVWPSDLAHYVEKYRVEVPTGLEEQAARGTAHSLSDQEIEAIVDFLVG